ncbi:Re/Si-specific NAD(P)(+) transhydrogenase subunit alpha [Aestuariirhabdus sp. Z084]|uniref:Re/Si-specific NAD(P)(+) transhydrogenase subunit alpha n=1 Tax=Aestuariirhabdus haliotis TaxID=2918751 RepID=UPI00201B378F|nr:Re/Si-specific NAD(P)(+) transhydrogenase subunit alpha [Aestuariirhabdus haliotis]MCL6417234.1 Re/Si-specific NAD(P)(+) transhydrogenase subunit alpha [Aestuariirhabdus haliotis]MCL6421201.1 Re/Si-specific NAD(P)(+) transhydrogenase subunit alpha [Aestuariirhabdus haliotis]
MAVSVAVPKEIKEGERRVAIVPEVASRLQQLGAELILQAGAGASVGHADELFEGATFYKDPKKVLSSAQVLLKVLPPTPQEVAMMDKGTVCVSFMAPFENDEGIVAMKERGITSFAMELIPRISRAQSMDALTSQASLAGYKAVLMAASISGKFFPMLTTAAGTIRPSKVLVIGAGVAGLQAIATARRLGAIVEAYDVRSAAREQVESLGARFVDTGVSADGLGGYARELTDEEKKRQQEVLAERVAASDVVITTAAIPGRASPMIISREMVESMHACSVIVDMAAEGGGNCELTRPDEQVEHNGVTVYGPLGVPSMLAIHASEMYAKNLLNFCKLIINEGELSIDWEDQVLAESCLTHDGEIRFEAARERIEGEQS